MAFEAVLMRVLTSCISFMIVATVATLPGEKVEGTTRASLNPTSQALNFDFSGTIGKDNADSRLMSLAYVHDDKTPSALDISYKTLTASFENTLRNCLGQHCFDQKPDGSSFETVGLLAPPESAGRDIIDAIRMSGGSVTSAAIHLEYDTHVPAYGYGKNHGWSRIIRLVRRPIPHALALLCPLYVGEDMDSAVLDTQVRQLVRWHCRLSHVAAHTKMLTIFIDDVIRRPYYELEKIITFAGIKMPDRQRVIKAGKTLRKILKSNRYDQFANVSAIKQSIGMSPFEVALDALEEELVGTGYLSKWPCRSFRNIHKQGNINIKLPVAADVLAANCSDKRVTCSVGFDRKGG
mmetsp:Transcript_1612/g.3025  ORF Transcript_1612/g.3025 Transcript_1612/m.3025 type:complete len:350 (+) Transcript_1612:123-1172(+)